jgi:hypothetical protein
VTAPHGHLDLDALADVLAGEGDDAHVRSCARCADALAELAAADLSVTAALHALPAPTVPAGLSQQLTRALHEERRREVAVVRPHRRRAPTWLPSAAAAVALVLAGAASWSLLDPSLQGSSSDTSTASGGGGGGVESGAAGESEDSASEAAAGPALPPAAATPTDWAQGAARPAALARLLVLADADVDAQERSDLAAPSAQAPPPAASALVGDALDRLRDPAELAACLGALPDGPGDVLAVDYATYDGAPAVAVVRPADTGSVQVTLVGSGCSAADPALLDQVVLPRP